MEFKYIAISINEAYANHAISLIKSAIRYNDNLFFFILCNDLSENSKERIKNAYINVEFVFVDKNRFIDLPCSKKWPLEIYFRLLLPELISNDIKFILYLDTDIMIRDKLDGIWTYCSDDLSVGALEEQQFCANATYMERLDLSIDDGYFNSGVLLMNLDYCRNNNIVDKCFAFLNKYKGKIKHPDQDCLNYVFKSNWIKLSPRWNFTSTFQDRYFEKEYLFDDFFKKNKNYPVIMHFSGTKPWNGDCKTIYKYEYYEYLTDEEYSSLHHTFGNFLFEVFKNFLFFFHIRTKNTNDYYKIVPYSEIVEEIQYGCKNN